MKYAGEGNNGNFLRDDEQKKKYKNGISRALRIYNKEVTEACSGISDKFGINGYGDGGGDSSLSIPGHGTEESRKIMESIVEDLKDIGPMIRNFKHSKEVLIIGREEEGKINALKKVIYDIGSRFDEKPELREIFFRCGDALDKYGNAIPFQDPPEYNQGGDLERDGSGRPWD